MVACRLEPTEAVRMGAIDATPHKLGFSAFVFRFAHSNLARKQNFSLVVNMASDEEDNRPLKRSRSRIIQACIPCHRSKRKCNRKKPCSQCLKRQNTKDCAYEALAAEDLETLEDDQTSLHTQNKILQSRITQLEGVISQLRNPNKEPRDFGTGRKRRKSLERVHEEDGVYYGRSFYLGGPAAPDLLHRMMSLLPNQPLDLLFAFAGGADNNGLGHTEGASILPTGLSVTCGVDVICNCLHSITRESLDAALESFIEIVDPLHHYIPLPWILQRYERCVDLAAIPQAEEAALVFAVLGLGNLVAPNPISWNFIAVSFQLLRMSSFLTSPSIDSIATFCFIAVYLQHEGKLNEYWPLLGMVIRLAQSMGLHRDPSLISNLTPEESEIRRRLFHAICAQETALSVMFGRPNGLGFFDCALPKDIGDAELFGEKNLTNLYPHEISYNRCTWELMEITRDLVANSFAQSKSSALSGKALIEQQIRQWHKNLPESLRFEPSGRSPQYLDGQEDKARYIQALVLHIIVNHNVLVLYRRPLLSNTHPEAAEPCIEASIAVAEGWKILQDSFPKIARIAWMQWFRAFHAALICLVAIRARETKSCLRVRAFNSWKSCVRIFCRIQEQNDTIRCCWRALSRLDEVVQKTINIRQRLPSQDMLSRNIQDTSSQLRIGPSTGEKDNPDDVPSSSQTPIVDREGDQSYGEVFEQHTPSQAVLNNLQEGLLVEGIDFDCNDLSLGYDQAFDSYMTQVTVSDESSGIQSNQADPTRHNIFDLDVSTWPFWLTTD